MATRDIKVPIWLAPFKSIFTFEKEKTIKVIYVATHHPLSWRWPLFWDIQPCTSNVEKIWAFLCKTASHLEWSITWQGQCPLPSVTKASSGENAGHVKEDALRSAKAGEKRWEMGGWTCWRTCEEQREPVMQKDINRSVITNTKDTFYLAPCKHMSCTTILMISNWVEFILVCVNVLHLNVPRFLCCLSARSLFYKRLAVSVSFYHVKYKL